MFWQGKKVLVLGYGITGKSMVSYLRKKGGLVYIYDDKLGLSFPDSLEWHNGEEVYSLNEIDIIAVSPGVPPIHPVIRHFKNKSIPIIGDIEISYLDRDRNDWIGITGTNGKTTTTMLVDFLLRNIGISSQTFGNIGVPVLDAVEFEGVPVVEISSFQLEYINTFKPHIGVFLNLTDDHLNRHTTMENYFRVKLSMFLNQDQGDWAILNKDDFWTKKAGNIIKSKIIWFSRQEKADVFADDRGNIFVQDTFLWNISTISRFRYPPYLEDLLAAIATVIAMGYENRLKVLDVNILSNFVFARHRMEEVANINGVIFINDSKATNVASTLAAISAFEGEKLLLILGGSKKDTSYDQLAKAVAEKKVKYVALIGETATEIANSLDKYNYRTYSIFDSLEKAVIRLYEMAESTDIVLLSPACASFDMFNNYKHRGDSFVEVVNELKRRVTL